MTLDRRYPSIDDLERAALRRIPHFAAEYLRGGIGHEAGLCRNRVALDGVLLDTRYLPTCPVNCPDLSAVLFEQHHDLPFGIAPLGLSGLMWPGAVGILAAAAVRANIPMGLSHFATTPMHEFHQIAGDNGWFQLYPPGDTGIREHMLERIAETGFKTLIVTVDVPSATRRVRELRVGLSVPPRLSPDTLWQILIHPRWALATLGAGIPDFPNLIPYIPAGTGLAAKGQHLSALLEGHVTTDVLQHIRKRWPGTLVVKGVMTGADACTALDCGADGIWVSNHGARQLDAAPAPTAVLPGIRQAIGPRVPLLADSGLRSGLDIARMLACGADFVFLGRAFMFAVAALGTRGGDHAVHVLRQELRSAMAQIGAASVAELRGFLRR